MQLSVTYKGRVQVPNKKDGLIDYSSPGMVKEEVKKPPARKTMAVNRGEPHSSDEVDGWKRYLPRQLKSGSDDAEISDDMGDSSGTRSERHAEAKKAETSSGEPEDPDDDSDAVSQPRRKREQKSSGKTRGVLDRIESTDDRCSPLSGIGPPVLCEITTYTDAVKRKPFIDVDFYDPASAFSVVS